MNLHCITSHQSGILNLKVHYHVHKSQAHVPTTNHKNPVHTSTPHSISLKSSEYYAPIYYYVFQVVSFLQVSPPKPCKHLPSLPNVPHAQTSSSVIQTISGEKYSSRSTSLCSFPNTSATSSLLGPNSFCSTLLPHTLCKYSTLNTILQVSIPYKTTCKIILPCI